MSKWFIKWWDSDGWFAIGDYNGQGGNYIELSANECKTYDDFLKTFREFMLPVWVDIDDEKYKYYIYKLIPKEELEELYSQIEQMNKLKAFW